jgi:hypothetical protein
VRARVSEGAKNLAAWIELKNPVIASVDHPNMLVSGNEQSMRVSEQSVSKIAQKAPDSSHSINMGLAR